MWQVKGDELGSLAAEDAGGLLAQNTHLKASLEECRKELFNVYEQVRQASRPSNTHTQSGLYPCLIYRS
jgi:hypothetical protein